MLIAVACLAPLAAQAQTLADRVGEANAEWMFARWQAQSENGDTVQLNVSWDLEKHVVILHVKAGEMESKGFTYVDPVSQEVKYVSFDSRGFVSKGSWGMESEELVLRTEGQSAERGPFKAAFVFTGNSSDGLQVRMHQVDASGALSDRKTVFKFKKQK
jgi:hypothetical protein